MFSQLVTYRLYGTTYAAIEHLSIDGIEQLHALVLKKSKDVFNIHNTHDTSSVSELAKKLSKTQHAFLIINTEKVLFRTIDGVFEPKKTIANAFPNLKIDDFYFELVTNDQKSFVAICRKEEVDFLLETYLKDGIQIVGFSLGVLAIKQLETIINQETINTSNNQITFRNEMLDDIQFAQGQQFRYTINGLEVNNNHILPLAGILKYYRGQTDSISNFSNITKQLKINFQQQRIFTFGLKISLATIFALLLFSFLFFTYYSDKINQLNSELEINKTDKSTLLQLTEEVQKKERLVNDISLTSSKASWYLDQIGMIIPNPILLSEIEFQPILKTIKENEPVEIEENTIQISGISNNGNDFTRWTQQLENEEWVKKVTIVEYGTNKNVNTAFKIKLEIN